MLLSNGVFFCVSMYQLFVAKKVEFAIDFVMNRSHIFFGSYTQVTNLWGKFFFQLLFSKWLCFKTSKKHENWASFQKTNSKNQKMYIQNISSNTYKFSHFGVHFSKKLLEKPQNQNCIDKMESKRGRSSSFFSTVS